MERSIVMTSEEAAWVARAKAGDQAAFAELFTRYERRIYSFIYRMMGNPEDAFDLTQETFLKAYRALGKTDAELNVNAWLHRIAANACTDVLRRRRWVRWLPWEALDRDDLGERLDGDPADALLGAETRQAVQRTLLSQPPHYRRALLLREHEGLSCEELGAALGLSAAAAKSLLFRAREDFRRRYGAGGLASDGGAATDGRRSGRTMARPGSD